MATRSYIGLRNTDGTVDYIYCHYDGYPRGVGETLTKHYTTYDKVKALIALGDLSALGNEIGEKQDFNDLDWKPEPEEKTTGKMIWFSTNSNNRNF
mgnify:CR=1 FL=1